MYETDLTFLEDKVVPAAFSWLAFNADVPWNDEPDKPGKSAALSKLVYPLRLDGKVHIIQASAVNRLPTLSKVYLVLPRQDT